MKLRPQVAKPKVEQARKHCCHNNRKPKRNVRAAKPTYNGEPMEQELRIPISLHEYFSRDFFQQYITVACHMVKIEIEGPSKGKVIIIEEKKTFMPKESLASYFSIEEAM
ncbi:hypothetical protein ACFX2G_028178 [Malus domestica]